MHQRTVDAFELPITRTYLPRKSLHFQGSTTRALRAILPSDLHLYPSVLQMRRTPLRDFSFIIYMD